MLHSPRIIQLPKVSSKSGFLSFVEEGSDLPISIKRAYWIYGSSGLVKRGNHAHVNSDRVIVCVSGSVDITLENLSGEKFHFNLNNPAEALYFPRLHWIDLTLDPDTIMIVFASCILEEDELVRDHEDFKRLAHSS